METEQINLNRCCIRKADCKTLRLFFLNNRLHCSNDANRILETFYGLYYQAVTKYNPKKTILTLFLDVSKIFDSISHNIMLYKLDKKAPTMSFFTFWHLTSQTEIKWWSTGINFCSLLVFFIYKRDARNF